MPTLDENSIDTIITDPPYGLEFMGKDWDKGVPGVHFWREALRIAKPGATLLAMGGTRTFHRLVCAIEDAGWEIRDTIAWLYGSGFPKSYDISKGIDKKAGAQREIVGHYENPDGHIRTSKQGYKKEYVGGSIEDSDRYLDGDLGRHITAPATEAAQLWHGWGTALKPAMELICVAQKPREGTYVENALKWGVSGLWIDGGRVETEDSYSYPHGAGGNSFSVGSPPDGKRTEPVECHPQGRFPANVIHDGSDEVLRGFPDTKTGSIKVGNPNSKGIFGGGNTFIPDNPNGGDSGSAARFFYCAKASRSERNAGLDGMEEKESKTMQLPAKEFIDYDGQKHDTSGDKRYLPRSNFHPTVKPIALMQYLARLTKTPTGGVVLDPFMGSGTTGIGAIKEGRDFIGIELDPDYYEIARRRIEYWQAQPRQLTLDNQDERE